MCFSGDYICGKIILKIAQSLYKKISGARHLLQDTIMSHFVWQNLFFWEEYFWGMSSFHSFSIFYFSSYSHSRSPPLYPCLLSSASFYLTLLIFVLRYGATNAAMDALPRPGDHLYQGPERGAFPCLHEISSQRLFEQTTLSNFLLLLLF